MLFIYLLVLLLVSLTSSSVIPNVIQSKESDNFEVPYEVYKREGIPLALQKHLHDQKIESVFMESYIKSSKAIQEDARINVVSSPLKYISLRILKINRSTHYYF